jgi:hypothetical protein
MTKIKVEFMMTKIALQKVPIGILLKEEDDKHNHKNRGKSKPH